jgi:hypothetical protein
MVMNEACSLIWASKNHNNIDDSSNPVGGSHFEIIVSSENQPKAYDSYTSSWISTKKRKGSVLIDDNDGPFPKAETLQYVCNLFANAMEDDDACEGENADSDPLWPEIVIPCFTEHKIEGQIY